MTNPEGYTALGFVGFTDKGTYDSTYQYAQNDLAHRAGSIWRCLIDNTQGITPTEGANWTIFMGEPTNMAEKIIAPLEDSPSENSYSAGQQLIFNDNLYEVIGAIAVGDNLVTYESDPTNANIKLAPKVTSQIQTLSNNVATNAADIQTLTNNLTSIKATGSTNNTGATILNGTYFYLNGVLVRAKTDIASGATFTLNTNYEVVTAGGLNALVQEHSHLLFDNGTIYQQGTQSIPQNSSYTVPHDGYYILTATGDDDWGAKFYLDSARRHVLLSNSNKYGISICIPLKKDTVIYTRADHGQYSVDGAYIW